MSEFFSMTPAEKRAEVLRLIRLGFSDAAIAAVLRVSVDRVRELIAAVSVEREP